MNNSSSINQQSFANGSMEESYYWLKAINKFNAKYSIPVIVVVGMVGNLLALAVFIFSPLRRLTISVYLAALSLMDFVFLMFLGIGWMDSIEHSVFHLPGICQLIVFMTYLVSFLSIWLIVAFTAQLYTSIYWTRIHRIINRPKRAVLLTAALVLAACVIYIFSFWYSRSVKIDETKYVCLFTGSPSIAIFSTIADTVLTLLVPFSLLLFMNIRIIHTLTTRCDLFHNPASKTQNSASSIAARNVLAEFLKTANRIKNVSPQVYNRSQSKGKSDNRRIQNCRKMTLLSKTKNDKNQEFSTCDLHEIHVGPRERGISLTMSEAGEINLNGPRGDNTISLTRFVVQNDAVEFILETDERGNEEMDVNRQMRRSSSKTEMNIMISTKRTSTSSNTSATPIKGFSANKKKLINKQQQPYPQQQQQQSQLQHQHHQQQENQRDGDYTKKATSTSYAKRHSKDLAHKIRQQRADSIQEEKEEEEVTSELINKTQSNTKYTSGNRETKNHQSNTTEHNAITSYSGGSSGTSISRDTISQLQKQSLRMVICTAMILLALNLPSHAIRLQSLIRSFLCPSYTATELEYHLQQLFQTIYYLNFVINFIAFSACAKSFQRAFLNLPRHIAEAFSLACSCCGYSSCCSSLEREGTLSWRRRHRQQRHLREFAGKENSRLVEICISELHLSQLPSFGSDFKFVSPPCLLRLESTPDIAVNAGTAARGGMDGGSSSGGGGGSGGHNICGNTAVESS